MAVTGWLVSLESAIQCAGEFRYVRSCGWQSVTEGETVLGVQVAGGVALRNTAVEFEPPGVGIAKSTLPSRLKSLATRSEADESLPIGNDRGVPRIQKQEASSRSCERPTHCRSPATYTHPGHGVVRLGFAQASTV